MPLHRAPDDGLGRGRLLDIVLADDFDAGLDGLTDFLRSPGLGGADELDMRGELLKDGSNVLPDHVILITLIGPLIQEEARAWTCQPAQSSTGLLIHTLHLG
jgi:hypothetical protein